MQHMPRAKAHLESVIFALGQLNASLRRLRLLRPEVERVAEPQGSLLRGVVDVPLHVELVPRPVQVAARGHDERVRVFARVPSCLRRDGRWHVGGGRDHGTVVGDVERVTRIVLLIL
jgi:hypothetical protein